MSKMQKIGSAEAAILHVAIDAALKTVAEKYGLLSLKTGTLSYEMDGLSFRVPVTGKVDTLNAHGMTSQAAANSLTASILTSHGLELNAMAYIQGVAYRVTGWSRKRPKRPVDLLNAGNGRAAHGPVNMVKAGIAAYKARYPERVNNG